MFWNALHHHHICQRLDHSGDAPSPLGTHEQTLLDVLIGQVQYPHRPPVMRLSTHEAMARDMVGALRTQPQARPVVEPLPPSWLLFLWNFQPVTTPDRLYPIVANLPSLYAGATPCLRLPAVSTGRAGCRGLHRHWAGAARSCHTYHHLDHRTAAALGAAT